MNIRCTFMSYRLPLLPGVLCTEMCKNYVYKPLVAQKLSDACSTGETFVLVAGTNARVLQDVYVAICKTRREYVTAQINTFPKMRWYSTLLNSSCSMKPFSSKYATILTMFDCPAIWSPFCHRLESVCRVSILC